MANFSITIISRVIFFLLRFHQPLTSTEISDKNPKKKKVIGKKGIVIDEHS